MRSLLTFENLLRAFVAVATISPATCAPADPPRTAEAAQRQAADLAEGMKTFEKAVGLAERLCLSNLTLTQKRALSLDLQALLNSVKASANIESQTEELRGASKTLTAAVGKLENDAIRTCMNQYIAPVYAIVIASLEKGDPNAAWPEPIEFRFNFARGASKDVKKYSEALAVTLLRSSRSPYSRRVTYQYDPVGSTYFLADIFPYPASGETITGTITAEIKADAKLSNEPPVTTPVCLKRPENFPRVRVGYDLFDCAEGNGCRPSPAGTGWLAAGGCTTITKGEVGPPLSPFRPVTYQLTPTAANSEIRRWIAPSLEALSQREHEGVGYTIFNIETDAFYRHPEVLGVEFEVRVNGTPVEENGLPAAMRPIANDGTRTFNYAFALQSLDFQGARGGCDDIALGLTPLLSQGRKGQQLTTHLSYAALRDVEPRKARLGQTFLAWRAAYITPAREWRHIPIVHSYIYPVKDSAKREKATADAETDKSWLDKQRYTYAGWPIVGVVRPPRTIQADGTAAFGLGVGLVQENGQVRFTFPEDEARKISNFLIGRREGSDARRVIAPEPYVFQAVGGARTVPGVCGSN